MMRHVDVEALLQRRIRLRAQMPLAEMPRGVPASFSDSASVRYSVFSRVGGMGWIDFWSGGSGFPGVASSTTGGRWQFGVVMPVRAGLRPVRIAERVGEHSGLAE